MVLKLILESDHGRVLLMVQDLALGMVLGMVSKRVLSLVQESVL